MCNIELGRCKKMFKSGLNVRFGWSTKSIFNPCRTNVGYTLKSKSDDHYILIFIY